MPASRIELESGRDNLERYDKAIKGCGYGYSRAKCFILSNSLW